MNDILKQGIMNEDWAREIAKDLCEGLSFMHSCNIAHRDIKPHNIMINSNGRPKLIDFGLSGDTQPLTGTRNWMAPEQFLSKPFHKWNPLRYDSWSLGAVLFRCLGGPKEYKIFDESYKKKLISSGTVSVAIVKASALAKDFLKKLLEPKHDQRALIS